MAKKLIEVALPLEKINAESAREKSIRHGHPSTLHLWWARRPLAAARAVIWSSLVDDPSSHPEFFPTEDDQNRERQRLFKILEDLVEWENSNNDAVLELAKAEIIKYANGNPPAFLDPFAGGGAIPLEVQRLGLEAHAHDLNPVAVMINKAMIEIPSKFAGRAPVNSQACRRLDKGQIWKGSAGLAEDVRYYGEWLKQEAFKRIGHIYPKVKVPREQGGGEATVIAWIWARTVKCPNPACGCNAPLVRSFDLSTKKGNSFHIEPLVEESKVSYIVKPGKAPIDGTVIRTGARCVACNGTIPFDYVREEGQHGRIGYDLMAIVAEGQRGRIYCTPDSEQVIAANVPEPEDAPETKLPEKALGFRVQVYGMDQHKKLFSNRQLTALTTFSDLVTEAQHQAEEDAVAAGLPNDHIGLEANGSGARAYGEAVGVYLAFVVDKLTDYHSTICSWHSSKELIRNTFGRQAIPMVWDYAETNPFSGSAGCFDSMNEWVAKCILNFPSSTPGSVCQFDAQSDCGLRNIAVSTDPPYYDNIGYADLSDFFYVWMRRSLKNTYPDLFRTMLVPKAEELIATPFRHEGSNEKAKEFFEDGMLSTCRQIYQYAREDVPVTIYYAYKQSDADDNGSASTGWETMLTAIIQAGFSITGTWPMRTEMANRSVASGTNALASSIVLVCRKRPADAPQTTRRNLIGTLRRELWPALKKLQESNIAPVDLAQSAIGPGMGVFSRYRQVLEADGKPMSVRSALQIINEEIDLYFNEQVGELDQASRFCVDLYTQNAYNDIKYGEAEVLANAKGSSIPMMASHGVLYAKAGNVHLIERTEMPTRVDANESNIWMLTQQLTQAMATGGIEACAEIVYSMFGSNAERAKDLAYRLYTIAEKKGWANEAYAYNSLVVAWPDIQTRAAAMKLETPEQISMFDEN